MKTPISKLIEILESQRARIPSEAYQKGVEYSIEAAKQLLPEERENMEGAYNEGGINSYIPIREQYTNSEWFNENYEQ